MAITGKRSYNATTGKIKRTSSGRIGYECSGPCSYAASDGSEHSEDFNAALQSGWSTHANYSLATNAGKLEITKNSHAGFLQGIASRTFSGTPVYVNIECEVFDNSNGFESGIGYDIGNIISQTIWGIFADWFNSRYKIRYANFETFISQTPVTGDKLSIELTQDGTDVESCFFVNSTLIYNANNPVSIAPNKAYGCQASANGIGLPKVIGQYDNFEAQIDT